MYEQKSSQQDKLKIFGIKIIEKICESVDIYDHEFQDDKEEQGVLAKLPHHFFHRFYWSWDDPTDWKSSETHNKEPGEY